MNHTVSTERIFTFHTDPGHGWLEVSKQDLNEFYLTDKISSFSYISDDKNTIYLEEDCDASLFISEYRKKYGDIKYTEEYSEDSFVRELEHYRV